MNHKICILVGLCLLVGGLPQVGALDNREEFVEVAANQSTVGANTTVQFNVKGVRDPGQPGDVQDFRWEVRLCTTGQGFGNGSRMKCWHGADIGYEDVEDLGSDSWVFDGDGDFCTQTRDRSDFYAFHCEVRNLTMANDTRPHSLEVRGEVDRGTLGANSFIAGSTTVVPTEAEAAFGTEDHSLGPLTESETNQFIFWFVLVSVFAWRGIWLPFLTSSFGLFGQILQGDPTGFMAFRPAALLTLAAIFASLFATKFRGLGAWSGLTGQDDRVRGE